MGDRDRDGPGRGGPTEAAPGTGNDQVGRGGRDGDDEAPQAVKLARRTIIYYTISYDNILYCNML